MSEVKSMSELRPVLGVPLSQGHIVGPQRFVAWWIAQELESPSAPGWFTCRIREKGRHPVVILDGGQDHAGDTPLLPTEVSDTPVDDSFELLELFFRVG